MDPHCPRCRQQPLELTLDASGLTLHGCPSCRYLFCAAGHLPQLLGREADKLGSLSRPSLAAGAAGFCPGDDGGLLLPCLPERLDDCSRCDQCGGLFLRPETLITLRRLLAPARSSLRARSLPIPAAPAPATRDEAPLAEARVGYGNPWLDLLTLPSALLLSALVSLSWFGRLLLFPVQIQFHELGRDAIPAWLSGRAALPLPFGFTFWREQQSLVTSLLVLAVCGLLIWKGVRESRGFAVLLGSIGVCSTFWLSWLMPAERSRMVTILGGGAGELMLSCLLLVSFYFPLPDRLRWDFFRFVLVLPAAGSFWASMNMWLSVRNGTQAMPMGSILGREGSGDLERLIAEYQFTVPELGAFYLHVTSLCIVVLLATYGIFALRALRTLSARKRLI